MATDSDLYNTYSRYHYMKFLLPHQNYFQQYSRVLYSLVKFMFSKLHSMLLPIYKFSATLNLISHFIRAREADEKFVSRGK
jgi:hypothetical protein